MKIAFINPKGWLRSEPWMPMGAVQLATILAAAGHDVRFFDEEQFRVPERKVREADVICITGMSHQAEGIALWTGRGRDWGKRVVIGGVHATLAIDEVDGATVVSGPGEEAIESALVATETSHIVAPPIDDIDAFPFPDRNRFGWTRYRERLGLRVPGRLFRPERYIGPFGHLRAIRVIAARGCPFACKFCCNPALTNRRLELRKPEAIAGEIAAAQKELGIKAVVFATSDFTLNRKWAEQVCEKVGALGVKWKATTRDDLVDRELLRLMKESGCVGLGFGVESGSDRVLAILGKGTTTAQARQAFAWAREVQLPTFAMFMTHVPGETPDSLRETQRLAKELAPPLGCTFQRFSPLPGSEFYNELEKWGKVVDRRPELGFGPVAFIPEAFAADM